MKKPRLLSLFTYITMIIFIGLVVIFGTVVIVFLIDDNSSLDELIKESTSAYEDGISQPLNSFDSILDDVRIGSYDYLEEQLVVTRENLLMDDKSYNDKLKSINTDLFEGYFLLSNDGDVIFDSTQRLTGNIYKIKDSEGTSVAQLFSPSISSEETYRFTSKFLKNGLSKEFYSVVTRLDENTVIGLMISGDIALELYKSKSIELFKMIPNSKLASFDLVDFEGKMLVGEISLSEEEIDLMLNTTEEKLPHIEHPDYGIIYFKVYSELEWILINRSQVVSLYQSSYEKLAKKGEIRLSVFLHTVFLLIIIIFIVFYKVLKDVKVKMKMQMMALNNAVDSNLPINETDIKFEEFRKIAHIFNRVKRTTGEDEPALVEKPATTNYKLYFLKMVKLQLIDRLQDAPVEPFELNTVIEECLNDLHLELSNFEIEFLGDRDVSMTQNKAALSGFVQFCALNLLINSNGSKVNMITIETIVDKNNIYLKINRNIGVRDIRPNIQELEVLDSIATIIESSLSASLILEQYSNDDRAVGLYFPIVK